jgi:hypothetical protein
LECDAIGAVDGELWFASPGHDGDSAFKGKARIGGVTSAASHGQQLAERKLLGSEYGPSRGSGIWGGASKLQFWSDLLLDIEFSRF